MTEKNFTPREIVDSLDRFIIGQLLGFFCVWAGGLGSGRALGCGEVEFFGQIRPHDSLMRYEIDIVRYQELPASGAAVAVGDATVAVDGDVIYSVPITGGTPVPLTPTGGISGSAEISPDGTTVVFVTHDPRMSEFAGRVVNLQDGKIINE